MDFIDELPMSQGHNFILVIIVRLSKYGHFIHVSHPYTASQIAEIFAKEVFCLHGMPRSILSDCDPSFYQQFLGILFQASRDEIMQ